jgi:hypothetical protein
MALEGNNFETQNEMQSFLGLQGKVVLRKTDRNLSIIKMQTDYHSNWNWSDWRPGNVG